jgi:hypothetical protein
MQRNPLFWTVGNFLEIAKKIRPEVKATSSMVVSDGFHFSIK